MGDLLKGAVFGLIIAMLLAAWFGIGFRVAQNECHATQEDTP